MKSNVKLFSVSPAETALNVLLYIWQQKNVIYIYIKKNSNICFHHMYLCLLSHQALGSQCCGGLWSEQTYSDELMHYRVLGVIDKVHITIFTSSYLRVAVKLYNGICEN